MPVKKVAILTAGGLAPCLSSCIGALIERYTEVAPEVRIICYRDGYQGLLQGRSVEVTPEMRRNAFFLHEYGGSPIGNSRVKLSNVADCVKRGLVKEGQDPRQVCAEQLIKDGVDVLHTIGGDDTNTAAADLAAYLQEHGYRLSVIGLPKTIDNDIFPLRQSLGALTAAEQASVFFQNVVHEATANPRMLLIHEVMGRNCGYLTAKSAFYYHRQLRGVTSERRAWLPELGFGADRFDVHGVYVPEMHLDLAAEEKRLRALMERHGCVNVFVSEGAMLPDIVADMTARGEPLQKDAFGHVKLDALNVGAWFGKRFGAATGAEKVLVQKSGYFSRSAPANADDRRLIKGFCDFAVDCALRGESGLIGHDIERDGKLRAIEFERVKGGRPFNINHPWFVELLAAIGQPLPPLIDDLKSYDFGPVDESHLP